MKTAAYPVAMLVLASILAGAGAARAAEAASDPTLDQVLAALDERQRTIERVESDFVQTKTSALFRAEIVSKGRMRADSKGNLAWEYAEPDPASFRIEGETVTLELPGAKVPQRMRLSEMPAMRRIFQSTRVLGLGQTSEALRGDYEVELLPHEEANRVSLRLAPRAAEVAGLFRHIVLVLDTASWAPVACEIHEGEGEWTRIEFHGMKTTRAAASER